MSHGETRLKDEIVRLSSELERLKHERDRDFNKLKELAQVAAAAKAGFLSNMSHELRTPLTAIIGFAELLSDQHFGKLNEKQQTYVREIYNAGQQLLTLVKDILDLAKAGTASQELQLGDVSIWDLLANSLSMVKERTAIHSQKLEMDVDESLKGLVIRADEIKLKQIMFNLLTNAVKFTPDGGKVKITARKVFDKVSVSVSDTGVGIRAEDLERIFEMFERIESSYRMQIQGTGLGLALTRRLVELHGGKISAFSRGLGQGATLTFTIPLSIVGPESNDRSDGHESRLTRAFKHSPSKYKKRKDRDLLALVVEHKSSNLKLIVDLLEREGCQSVIASNAEEALEMVINVDPDLILINIALPGTNGLEASRLFKKNVKTKHIPVVVMTGDPVEIDKITAAEAVCEAFVRHPIDPDALVDLLSRFKKY
ncbi:MAG: ATP-binding protein [Desulfomonilaceae bacterium]